MLDFFYNYHNQPLAIDLYTQVSTEAAPPPPTGGPILVDDGNDLLADDSNEILEG
jgi:hypothetical protein